MEQPQVHGAGEMSEHQIREVFNALRLGDGSVVAPHWNQAPAAPAHQLVYFPVSGTTAPSPLS